MTDTDDEQEPTRYDKRAFEHWLNRVESPFPLNRWIICHDVRFCPCLTCADGRAARRERPLIPEIFRENVPD